MSTGMKTHQGFRFNVGKQNDKTSNYWQQFKFKQDPFPATDPADFLFTTPQWEEHLDLLQHLCQFSNLLLVVTGDIDSGKSTLLNQFYEQVSDGMTVYQMSGDPRLDSKELLGVLADGFDLQAEADPNCTIEELFMAYSESMRLGSQHYTLLIDDAHQLPADTLEVLLDLIRCQTEGQNGLRVVLVGEPELEETLERVAKEHAASDFLHTINLKPYSIEETEMYLKFRFQKAGRDEGLPFSKTAIARIHKLSEGCPGRINQVAKQTLLDLEPESDSFISNILTQHRTKVVGATVVFGALFAISVFMDKEGYQESLQDPVRMHQVRTSELTAQEKFAQKATDEGLNIVKKTSPVTEKVSTNDNDQALKLPEPAAFKPKPLAAKSQKVVEKVVTQATPTIIKQAKPVTVAEVKAPVNSMPTVVASKPSVVKSVSKQVKMSVPKKPVAIMKPVARSNTANTGPLTTAERGLLATDAAKFTLQVIGTRKKGELEKFIQKNNLGSTAKYYQTIHNGSVWYVLTIGKFKSSIEARYAVSQLPESVQKLKPWARSFSSIHKALEKRAKASGNAAQLSIQSTPSMNLSEQIHKDNKRKQHILSL